MKKVSQILIYVSLAALMALVGVLLTGKADLGASEPRAEGEQNSGSFNRYSKFALLALKEPDETLAMPVKGVSRRQIADTFGAERTGGRSHSGQDIFARRGTPVYSATEGVVLRVGENDLGGKVVFVYGAGGRRYYYAHLDDFAPELAAGDVVTTETLLGYVGTTGNAKGTPPHLHFGLYGAGGAIDPLPLLIDRTFAKN
jgi:murein DD-endopeptidase MepM/ murein hydrolase activator NlpD